MRVVDIIRHKGAEVGTVLPDASVAEAVGRLGALGVGALIVSEGDGVVDGILSERDVVRRLDVDGAAVLEQRVAELMTSEVVTCELSDTISDLMATMTERRIRHIPVVEDGRLAGVVSIGDVVNSRLQELEAERQHLEDYITRG